MPRSRGGPSPGGRRPTAPPAAPPRSAPQQPQARPASTMAQPPQQAHQQPPPAQAVPQSSGGPGLFGQMASTAAGVAVGSSIGHAIGGFFGGGSGSSTQPAEQQPIAAQTENGQYTMNQNYQTARVCEKDVTNFRQCLDQNQGDLTICGWYLDQLKSCQAAAAQYS